MTKQAPVQASQHEPVCTHGFGVQSWPRKKTNGAVHWLELATAKHWPVAGLQHAPPLGKQVIGVQVEFATTVPPAMAHACVSMTWQRPQQQQAETGAVQLGNTVHGLPMEDVPPT